MVTVGILPLRIKATVLLLKRHCLHVSSAKYGHTALWENFHNLSEKHLIIFRTKTKEDQPTLHHIQSNKQTDVC